MPAGMRRLLRSDTLISVYRSTYCWDFAKVPRDDARRKLILIRVRNNNNCLTGDPATEPTLKLFKVQLRMPHVLSSEINKLLMLRFGKWAISEHAFRSWDLYEFPLAEHNQAFVSHQDCYSVREAMSLFSLYKQVEKKSCPRISQVCKYVNIMNFLIENIFIA